MQQYSYCWKQSFLWWSVPKGYKQGIRLELSHSRVEAELNTSTVALRVVGDEKGTLSDVGLIRG
jgi:hypothetical protein